MLTVELSSASTSWKHASSALQSELDAIEQLEKSVTPPAQSRSSAKKEKNLQAEEADRARRRELIRQKLETLLRDSDSMLRDAEQ
jgi:hypothetical protein